MKNILLVFSILVSSLVVAQSKETSDNQLAIEKKVDDIFTRVEQLHAPTISDTPMNTFMFKYTKFVKGISTAMILSDRNMWQEYQDYYQTEQLADFPNYHNLNSVDKKIVENYIAKILVIKNFIENDL